MAKKPKHIEAIGRIVSAIDELRELESSLSRPAATKTRALLGDVRKRLDEAVAGLDPIKEPNAWFDPADPDSAGRLVAAALLAQPRVPLNLVPRSYGAGVYAIYYSGDHPVYAPISGTETPIYVGKANPSSASAKTPREQGDRLYGRLADHRKMIRTVQGYAETNRLENPLRIEDFECRRLVTATNAQMFAETHLISLFKPVWNAETKICWGISKHGDTEGRNNARSPWDVLHPGRVWAMAEKLANSREPETIVADVAAHLQANPPFGDRDEIIDLFLRAFAQDPMVAEEPVTDDAETAPSPDEEAAVPDGEPG